ncbi:MAG: S-layer homology domain-containing protein [Lachnospiraceae bacterium]|nr:S-layer homology domain-containing protein [Lachnospiraceae bacterium]
MINSVLNFIVSYFCISGKKRSEEGEWYVEAIQYVYDNGIMVGTGSTFGTNNQLKREQFAATLYSMAGKPSVGLDASNPFSDVPNKAGYPRDAILWAVKNDVAAGNADGTFGVGKSIQRQAVASMLYKYAQLCGYDMTKYENAIDEFNDADKVQSWAINAMKWAVSQELISGKGGKRLDPLGVATRAECAAMIRKLLIKNPDSISLNETSATMVVGSELRLTPTLIPKIRTNETITWISSDPNVASVENGLHSKISLRKICLTEIFFLSASHSL